MSIEKKWYVVYTKPRWEKKVAAILLKDEVTHYCPLNKVSKKWSDRVKIVIEPLFKGYLFVQLAEQNKWDIKMVDGILNFVYWLGKPAVVKENEIENIRKFLGEFDDVVVENQYPIENEMVQIKQGVMMDYMGMVIEVMGNKAKVQIASMGIAITATFDRKNLLKMAQA